MRKKRVKLSGLLLSVTLIMTQLPAVAMAENNAAEDGVSAFSSVQGDFLNASIATPGQADEVIMDDIEKEDGKEIEKYRGEGYDKNKVEDPVKMITGWTFIDDENLTDGELALSGVHMDSQADFDTVVSMLPAQIRAEVEIVDLAVNEESNPEQGKKVVETLNITGWNCLDYHQDDEAKWPITGKYIFTAELPEDYICDPLPKVQVILGGASVMTINDRYTVEGLKYKEIGPRAVQLIGQEDSSFAGTLTVPAEITADGKTFAVTSIGSKAFEFSNITGLDLSGADYLTRIESRAFSRCADLTGTVKIPGSLIEIGEISFVGTGITELDLSEADNLIRIDEMAFRGCSTLAGTVKIPRSVVVIGGSAFYNTGITELDLNEADNLISIGTEAFRDCMALARTVKIPASVTKIEEAAFHSSGIQEFIAADNAVAVILRNSGVEESKIKLPDSTSPVFPSKPGTQEIIVDNLKYTITGTDTVILNGFEGISMTGILTIPAVVQSGGITYRVTEIAEEAFRHGTMTGLDLSRADNLVYIGFNAFISCKSLTGLLTIPASVTEIGGGAFEGTKFTSVLIKGRLDVLRGDTFPDNIPIHCEYPATQLLVNVVFNRNQIPTASWNGKDSVPAGAIVTVDNEIRVTGDVALEEGVEATIEPGGSIAIESGGVITIADGASMMLKSGTAITINAGGTMMISSAGVVDGTGTIIIEKGGKLIGTPGKGITVIDGNEPVIDEPVIDEPVIDNKRTSVRVESSYTNPNILLGTWVRTDIGIWRFRLSSGGYAKNRWGIEDGLWYRFNTEGHMLTGWQLIDGKWYYLCTEEAAKERSGRKEGAMVTGWQFDPIYQKWFYFDVNGAMVTGWREIGGKWYYFSQEADGTRGSMFAGRKSPDGYELDEDGVWNGLQVHS